MVYLWLLRIGDLVSSVIAKSRSVGRIKIQSQYWSASRAFVRSGKVRLEFTCGCEPSIAMHVIEKSCDCVLEILRVSPKIVIDHKFVPDQWAWEALPGTDHVQPVL